MIKIMIADKHVMLREGLKALLDPEDDMKIVAEEGEIEACLEKLREEDIDVLLLDHELLQKDRSEMLVNVIEDQGQKLLLLVERADAEMFRMEEYAAAGYVFKEASVAELKDAIRSVAGGEAYIPPVLTSLLQERQTEKREDEERIGTLTHRELEVLKLLAVGMYNKEVAEDLHISERTVKNHVSNIFKKLEVADRTQAAVFAIRNKMIQL